MYLTTRFDKESIPTYPNDLTPPAVCDWEAPSPTDVCVRCQDAPAGYSYPGEEAKYCWPCLCAVEADNQAVRV